MAHSGELQAVGCCSQAAYACAHQGYRGPCRAISKRALRCVPAAPGRPPGGSPYRCKTGRACTRTGDMSLVRCTQNGLQLAGWGSPSVPTAVCHRRSTIIRSESCLRGVRRASTLCVTTATCAQDTHSQGHSFARACSPVLLGRFICSAWALNAVRLRSLSVDSWQSTTERAEQTPHT